MSNFENLLKSSISVFKDCVLENGAIIAANTDKIYYPSNVQNYRFVWPRDVAFTIYALFLLGMEEDASAFIHWLLTRAEGFEGDGMLWQRYITNGARDTEAGDQYQPDQAGALLWSLPEVTTDKNNEYTRVIELLADGLCDKWEKDHFILPTFDLWEEKRTLPRLKETFCYTLAACGTGLLRASDEFGNKRWLMTGRQMASLLEDTDAKFFTRTTGLLPDQRIDASLLGLIWPFRLVEITGKHQKTLEEIVDKLLTQHGMMRYEHDEYDGGIEQGKLENKGGGAWPLLTYWYMIVLGETGQKTKAVELFENYTNHFQDHIPEQLFINTFQTSVSPLCWSHAMFVIAGKKLGFF